MRRWTTCLIAGQTLLLASLAAASPSPQPPQGAAAPAKPPPSPEAAPRTVLVLIYDGVELGDLAAPIEVLKVAAELGSEKTPAFQIRLAAEKAGPVAVDGGFTLTAQCALADCPPADILVLAGGRGALEVMNHPALIDWVRQRAASTRSVLGICTGTFLLAKAGLLDGQTATTHPQGLPYLKYLAPKANVVSGQHFVRAGKMITTAGVSSSLDAALALVAETLGPERAQATANWLDHPWKP
jgi:transcriptional regulator GlxA family with amidase domain